MLYGACTCTHSLLRWVQDVGGGGKQDISAFLLSQDLVENHISVLSSGVWSGEKPLRLPCMWTQVNPGSARCVVAARRCDQTVAAQQPARCRKALIRPAGTPIQGLLQDMLLLLLPLSKKPTELITNFGLSPTAVAWSCHEVLYVLQAHRQDSRCDHPAQDRAKGAKCMSFVIIWQSSP